MTHMLLDRGERAHDTVHEREIRQMLQAFPPHGHARVAIAPAGQKAAQAAHPMHGLPQGGRGHRRLAVAPRPPGRPRPPDWAVSRRCGAWAAPTTPDTTGRRPWPGGPAAGRAGVPIPSGWQPPGGPPRGSTGSAPDGPPGGSTPPAPTRPPPRGAPAGTGHTRPLRGRRCTPRRSADSGWWASRTAATRVSPV